MHLRPWFCSTDNPLLRMGVPKVVSGVVVFAFSATMHEIILSLPFKYVAFHAFNGMVSNHAYILYCLGYNHHLHHHHRSIYV